ncbi:hypothetical protein HBB16_09240 [Pseudonocardia sp. MCCB 268]|nr:hypothetical protein [Pseudonocardia cytotoxica]
MSHGLPARTGWPDPTTTTGLPHGPRPAWRMYASGDAWPHPAPPRRTCRRGSCSILSASPRSATGELAPSASERPAVRHAGSRPSCGPSPATSLRPAAGPSCGLSSPCRRPWSGPAARWAISTAACRSAEVVAVNGRSCATCSA